MNVRLSIADPVKLDGFMTLEVQGHQMRVYGRNLGSDQRPVLICNGLGQAVEDRLLLPVEADLAAGAVRHGSDRALVAAVLADPFAIGLTTASETGLAQQLALSGDCGFSLDASRRNAKTEDYPLTAPVFGDSARAGALAAATAIGRNGEMEDLDGLTVFLASRASDYITGQVLSLDGGYTAK